MLGAIKKSFYRSGACAALGRWVSALEQLDSRRDVLRVLTYHRVADPAHRPDLCPQLISATPAAFQQQMAYLADRYRVVSLSEVLDAFHRRRGLGPRAVMITFDDAYRDFSEHAWPVLRQFGLPATLFVATAFAADPMLAFWWDRLHNAVRLNQVQTRDGHSAPPEQNAHAAANEIQTFRRIAARIKSLRHDTAMRLLDRLCNRAVAPSPAVLGWPELRTLAREGVTLGAHTRTHPLMDRLSVDDAAAQAVGSLEDLRSHIGPTSPVFAFPGGRSTPQIRQALRRSGIALAFTTRRGVNTVRRSDPLALKRIQVTMSNSPAVFRGRLLSFWPHLRSLAFM